MFSASLFCILLSQLTQGVLAAQQMDQSPGYPQNQMAYMPQQQQPQPQITTPPRKTFLDDDDSSDDDDPEYEDDWSAADRLSTKDLDARRYYKLKFRRMYLRKLERILKRIGQGVEVRKGKQEVLRGGRRCACRKHKVVEVVDDGMEGPPVQHVHHYYSSAANQPTVMNPLSSGHPVMMTVPHPATVTTSVMPPPAALSSTNVPKRKKTVIYYDE